MPTAHDEGALLKLGLPECPVDCQMFDLKKGHGSKPGLARRRPSERAPETPGNADGALAGVRPDEGENLKLGFFEDHEQGPHFRSEALLKFKIARRRARGLMGAAETLGHAYDELEVPAQTLLAQ